MVITHIQKIKKNHPFLYISSFLLGCCVMYGYNTFIAANKSSGETSSYVRRQNVGKFIAPLLLTTDSVRFYRDDSFSRTVTNYINTEIKNGEADNVSFYFKDLSTGTWTGVNENERYAPASLMKVPIMIAIFKQAESDPSILEQKLAYDGTTDLNKNEYYQPKDRIAPYKPYTVLELIHYMAIDSDNNATALLLSVTKQNTLSEIFTDLGLPVPQSYSEDTVEYMSAKLYSRLFRVLYNSTYLNDEYSEMALEILSAPDFPSGLSGGVPQNVPLANKFGERTLYDTTGAVLHKELHDCGIVYKPKKPYLICIMTRGSDYKQLENIIHTISEMAYDKMK